MHNGNKFLTYFLVLQFVLLASESSHAQKTSKFDTDFPGARSFKSWLQHSWLKPFITFDTLDREYDKTFLTLTFDCNNDCSDKWSRMRSSFDSLSSISFEEYLWKKANFHLGVPNNELIVEIYNKPKPSETPCFYRGIYYADTLIVKTGDCKDIGVKAMLNYDKFNPAFMMKSVTVAGIERKATQILDTLYKRCEQFYKARGKDILITKYRVESNLIEFQVRNLRNEVLMKSPFSGTIEILQFTITCNFFPSGVKFETIVNGKYASSRMIPYSDKGYNDMEDDYMVDFQRYVNEFTNNRLLSWLR